MISLWLLETGDEEQKLLSESCPSISNALTHFTSCGTDCLEKTTLPSFYHVYRITALGYTKHYSLQLIPLMLKTQACTYSVRAVEKASVWEDYGYSSDAQHFLVEIFHNEAIASLRACSASASALFLLLESPYFFYVCVCKAMKKLKTNCCCSGFLWN